MLGLPIRPAFAAALALLAAALTLISTTAVYANVALTLVSTDPFTNPNSQHRTEVEPDTFTFGSTIVSVFQTGRIYGGGSADIGWATSKDSGASWAHDFLPGITVNKGGPFQAVSDPAVAFDARHNVWLVSSLAINSSGGAAVLTSRSTDGGLTWGNPVTAATGSNLDKNWIVCDNTPSSGFYGNCYTEYDVNGAGNALRMTTSSNGGATWGGAKPTGDGAAGLGGQPVVRPNGTVIVPYLSNNGSIRSFRSIDGGSSWRATVLVSGVSFHPPAGRLRAETLPSAEVDAVGTVYVAWPDCRFRSGCPSNDIVISKSTSETTWAAPFRVPIDPTTSSVDHFTPGIGVDKSTSGGSARVGLTYYYYPTSNCSAATCQLDVGFLSSTNGGTSWSAPSQVSGPMTLSWLPDTSQGRMFGDYISTSVLPPSSGGKAYPALPIAFTPGGGQFNQATYVPTGGLPIAGGARRATAAAPANPAPAAPAGPVLRTAN
jgi:hypothetical protein